MAIVKMSKFTLFAFKNDKEAILASLQKFEGVQFINLQETVDPEEFNQIEIDSEESIASNLEAEQAKVKFAIDFLKNYIPQEKGLKVMMKGKRNLTYDDLCMEAKSTDYLSVYEDVKVDESRLNYLKAECTRIDSEISFLEPWKGLDISLDDLRLFKSTMIYLGYVQPNLKDQFKQEIENNVKTAYTESVTDTKEGSYFLIAVHKEEQSLVEEVMKKVGFSIENLVFDGFCKDQIAMLQTQKAEHALEIEKIIAGLEKYKENIPALEIGYEFLGKDIVKARATANFLKTNQTIVIEGWLPKENGAHLNELIESISKSKYHLDIQDPTEEDDVPILLKNGKLAKPFESFISMYGMPNYKGIDPTTAILPFYALFYGLMLSDAIYGLIQFLACGFVLWKFNINESTRNMVKLFLILSIPTIIIGVLYGSYFGGAIAIAPIWMDPTKNVILVLLVSFALGIVHIFTGLFIKAFMLIRDKKYLDALYDVGLWVITLVSAGAYLAGSFGKIEALADYMTSALYVMIAGMVGLVLTQGRANKGIGAKLGGGLYGLYGITGYIGDLVSYSRLMALGLATSFIGGAFNSMVDMLGTGAAKWLLGPVIFLAGHTFNLLINALGAYVHSLRLQYLEFFGKFYESGGKPFTPFKSVSKYLNIVKN